MSRRVRRLPATQAREDAAPWPRPRIGRRVETLFDHRLVFTVAEAAHAARVPERSIQFWSGPARILVPEVAASGRGSRKLLSERDVVRLRVTYVLTQRWVGLETIRALMQADPRDPDDEDWFALRSGRLRNELGELLPDAHHHEELLICLEGREWRRWVSGARPREADGTPQRGALPGWEQVWRLVEEHEDAIVVNLGQIKREIASRL